MSQSYSVGGSSNSAELYLTVFTALQQLVLLEMVQQQQPFYSHYTRQPVLSGCSS